MSFNGNSDNYRPDKGLGSAILDRKRRKTYSVILDGINSDIETVESFAIKFSILLKVPVTKVKHMMRKLPSVVWTGTGKSRAKQLLALIEEAGGRGEIVESQKNHEEAETPAEVHEYSDKPMCRSCGFPLKKDEKFCSFCLTSVDVSDDRSIHTKVEREKSSIPPSRLLFYLIVLIVLFILAVLTKI